MVGAANNTITVFTLHCSCGKESDRVGDDKYFKCRVDTEEVTKINRLSDWLEWRRAQSGKEQSKSEDEPKVAEFI